MPWEASRTLDPDLALGRALDGALAPWKRATEPFTLLFSGGVDSGLLAFELGAAPGFRALTLGRPGSRDLSAAERVAGQLGLAWSAHVVSDDELARLDGRLADELDTAPPALRGVFLALGAALGASTTTEVLLGQGADELFLGYAHFRGLRCEEAAARAEEDLRRLLEEDWPRTVRLARALGRQVTAPYLSPAFREAALAIPIGERLPAPESKRYFRQWAARRGLPDAVAHRPKVALQYGTGVARWLRAASQRPGAPAR